MARRRAARARARRAAAAAGGATTGPKVRRGSWHPKQRSTHFEDALEKYKRWRYDPLKSLASQHFKDDANLNERSYAGAQFYDQFHMPRAVFEEVLRELSAHPPFADKNLGHNKAKWGTPSHPLRYKLAAAIYYLVDGCTMKRACERCHLDSDGRWRLTFHKYMAFLQEHIAPKHIYAPRTQAELQRTEGIYAKAGFPGCIGSMDVVHVPWLQCPEKNKFMCTGKEGFPTLCWNCVCDQNRIFIAVPGPQIGARNDKTIAKVDPFTQTIHREENPLFVNYTFFVRDSNGNTVQLKGVWVLTDGGYHG